METNKPTEEKIKKQNRNDIWSHYRFGPCVEDWHRGAKNQKEETPDTRGVMVVVTCFNSTGLHCTTWSNHRELFHHAHNANDVELPPKNTILAKHAENNVSHDDQRAREARDTVYTVGYCTSFDPPLVCVQLQKTKQKELSMISPQITVIWMSIYNITELWKESPSLCKRQSTEETIKIQFCETAAAPSASVITFTASRVLTLTSNQLMTAINLLKKKINCNYHIHSKTSKNLFQWFVWMPNNCTQSNLRPFILKAKVKAKHLFMSRFLHDAM